MSQAPSPARLVILLVTGVLLLCACGADFPKDPEGTLDRVRSEGRLVVGASLSPPFVTLPEGPDADPEGTEVDLVEDFAASLGAEVEWSVNGEGALFTKLERGELDMVVGGLTSKTPHSKHAALTRPYREVADDRGELHKQVMAVRMGENALLVALERFLDDQQVAQDGGEVGA